MTYQNVFKRYELKYIITLQQKERLLEWIAPYMHIDRYGRALISNIYYDTPDFRLIRTSIDKPPYKEKLRVRSYDGKTAYVELKKKYDKVVYKRRLAMTPAEAERFLCGAVPPPDCQIGREIDYFVRFYQNLAPAVYLSYEREAYYSKAGDDLRITFDDNILARRHTFDFAVPPHGVPVLEQDKILMEIKTSTALPLWLTAVLSQERIYKTSFSKYGTAYTKYYIGENRYAFNHI